MRNANARNDLKPERFLKLFQSTSSFGITSRSRTKTVVSSVYKDDLITFSPTLIPFIVFLFLVELNFDTYHKKQSGQRATLSDTPL